MSLFKARDWWHTKCGTNEEFDTGCMCIGNIDNSQEGEEKILVGSFSGMLRAYLPSLQQLEDGTFVEYQPSDMLFEAALPFPILQVQVGRFVSSNGNVHLAVLHPRRLTVYQVSSEIGSVDHGVQCHLSLVYEHNLKRSAYNLTTGPFGGTEGRDFLCVQSLDGTLMVFEQESFAFACYLPGFLLPAPMQYVPNTDSLITVSSSWNLESYRYQDLAVSVAVGDDGSGKKLVPEWSYKLGEPALQIVVVPATSGSSSVVILGERNVYCFKDTGIVKFMKKLDFNPLCCYAYSDVSSKKDGPQHVRLLVCSHTETLLIYNDIKLQWAAQMPYPAVTINTVKIKDLQGVLVSLSENGELSCAYLGTAPALFMAVAPEVREISLDESEKELAHLQKLIKNANTNQDELLSGPPKRPLTMTLQLSSHMEPISHNNPFDGSPSLQVRGALQLVAQGSPIYKLNIIVKVQEPIKVNKASHSFDTINNSMQLPLAFFMSEPFIPSSLQVHIVATFTGNGGVPQVVSCSSRLPLCLVSCLCPPGKDADSKVTLSTNRPAVSLNDLFPEFGLDPTMSNAVAFEYVGVPNVPSVTILCSKSSQRYRLQSDSFPALWLVAEEVVDRLKKRFDPKKKGEFIICYSSSLPLQEVFSEIDAHFIWREKITKLKMELAHSTTQFRAVQRRLLTKFKDKNPSQLANLDVLLEGTYMQVLTTADDIQDVERKLRSSCSRLSCSIQMLILLLQLQTGMKADDINMVKSSLSKDVDEHWEENVDVSITHLLRTSLAKGGIKVDAATLPPAGPIEPLKDITALKKHIGQVIEKLSRGSHMATPNIPNNENNRVSTPAFPEFVDGDLSNTNPPTDQENSLPVGSRFGSARVRSARKRSAIGRPSVAVDVDSIESPSLLSREVSLDDEKLSTPSEEVNVWQV